MNTPPYIHIGPTPKLPRLDMIAETGYGAPIIHRPEPVCRIDYEPSECYTPVVLTVDIRDMVYEMLKSSSTEKWKKKLLAKFLIRLQTKKHRRNYKRRPAHRKHGHPSKQRGKHRMARPR